MPNTNTTLLTQRLLRHPAWLFFIALCIVRLPTFLYQVLDEDETIHATIATNIVAGLKPYVTAVDSKFPLLWYQYAGVFALFGKNNMIAVHAYTFVIVFLTSLLLCDIGRRLRNQTCGVLTGLFYAFFSTASFYKILASNFELHLLIFECAAIDLVLLSRGKKFYAAAWFMAGIAICLSILTKQQGGMLLMSLPTAYLLSYARKFKPTAISFAALGFGLATATAVFVAFAWQQDYLHDMIQWAVIFPKSYIQQGDDEITNPQRSLIRISFWLLGTFPLWFAATHTLCKHWRDKAVQFSVILLFASFIPVSLGGRYFSHYFLLNLPGLCILAAFGFEDFFSQSLSTITRRTAFFLTALPVCGFLIANLMTPVVRKLTHQTQPDYQMFGTEIKKLTAPDDRIFVWGWAPEFYLAADRLPASRFVFCDYLAGRTGGAMHEKSLSDSYEKRIVPGAWDMLKEDFAKNPPRLIIDSAAADIHEFSPYPMARYVFLREYIANNYEPISIGGVPAFLRKN